MVQSSLSRSKNTPEKNSELSIYELLFKIPSTPSNISPSVVRNKWFAGLFEQVPREFRVAGKF